MDKDRFSLTETEKGKSQLPLVWGSLDQQRPEKSESKG
jgi:hypothetical protein